MKFGKRTYMDGFLKGTASNLLQFLKWVALSCLIGVTVGLVGTAFSYGMKYATDFREGHTYIIIGLPLAGLIIAGLYHLAHRDNDKGTNSVLSAVRSEDELSITMAPLILIGTVLTHLFGGSAGREGAALQLGGSIGNFLGKVFRLNEKDVHIMILCGMSACFSALFGTPMAAAVFSMEVVSVGIMYYFALVPCVLASLIATGIASALGVEGESMMIASIPEFGWISGGKIILLAALCAGLSVVFCVTLHLASAQGKKWLKNPYLRIVAAGVVIALINFLLQTTDYMGAGMQVIERCIVEGTVKPEAFVLKILLTAITLGAGYKGGEIVPTFFVGATFGCLMGGLLGLSPSLCGAIGMIAMFCGVTNSPIASLLIGLEIFGMGAAPYLLLAVAVSYMLSGYHSLYQTQKIMYSKYREESLETLEREAG